MLRSRSRTYFPAFALLTTVACHRQAAPVFTPPPPAAPQQTTPAPTPPPNPIPRRKPKPTPAPPPVARQAPAAPAANPEAQPPPRLGILLSTEEQHRLNADIDQDLKQARGMLASFGSRQLTPAQHDTVAQIRSFVAQTETLRQTDLPAARGLARKAAVLAADLAARLR